MNINPQLSNLSEELLQKASQIRLLICDVDGVLSNGQVIFGNQDEELKTFNIKDGFGLKALQNHGIGVAIITGRNSKIVERRCQELGIEHLYQGHLNKVGAFDELCEKFSITANEVCHVGDDLPDLPLIQKAGLGVAVKDAHWFVLQHADWSTKQLGGFGAVREVCDLILHSQQKLKPLLESYLGH
ncbi:3-deoxy-manno-octulosonate-8-phosphatase KdsC [Kangiella sp. TOML190]|uniref:3-deoxy-manno-octulosonate-8-phosphatase KdsC n=1 Tax=Kangiella sp. TOML190 TaxID=2931351 RepID=UPI00203F4A22|nr:3-deoxy-manno-octulosonate-8-phosphatase KdsC [Kangiella sp. TOML190]